MTSMFEVIQDGYIGQVNETVRQHLSRIERRVQGMLLTINELMTLAKSQNKQRKVEPKEIDLKGIASRIQQTFQDEANKKRLTFEVTLPGDLPKMKGDQEMIEQMFENLVSNAIKYTPDGGRVGMTFWPGMSGTIRIVVSDNGIGIPKDELNHLFTEFFRGSNAQTIIGTGLGLATVKEIVDRHGGQIQVESEEGFGTTFIVHLPVSKEEERAMRKNSVKEEGVTSIVDEKAIQKQLENAAFPGPDRAQE